MNSFTGPFEFYDGKQGRLAFRPAYHQGRRTGLSQDCLQANGPWNHQVKHQQNEVHMQPRGESKYFDGLFAAIQMLILRSTTQIIWFQDIISIFILVWSVWSKSFVWDTVLTS